jgi:solute carrier family 9 (sodium/hydrogen exchanger), member 8
LEKYDGFTGEWTTFFLSLKENLLLSSVICSSDIIAAISLIDPEEHPKLAGIIFGEGIINDAVAIVLFKTVYIYTHSSETFEPYTPIKVLANFFRMSIISVVFGLFVGISKF